MRFFIGIAIIVLILTSGFVKPVLVQDIRFKYFGESELFSKCTQDIMSIAPKYLKGINTVFIFDRDNKHYLATYHLGGVIKFYNDCHMATIVHELAHHCQKLQGDSLYKLMNHIGQFDTCYSDISKDLNR